MTAPVDYVFLHGGGQGSWVWSEALQALDLQTGGSGRALALDVPGCGTKRDRPTEDISVDDIAAELVADIRAAAMSDVVLIGHSQAGCILPKMAALAPELFRRLIYVSCSSPLPGQTVAGMIGVSLRGEVPDEVGWPVDPKTHSMAERYPVMFCNDMSPSATAEFMRRVGRDGWPMQSYAHIEWSYEHLSAIPATYVLCLQDNILPPEWQERFAERFHAERIVRIDAGHQVMNTRPHALAEVLRAETASGS